MKAFVFGYDLDFALIKITICKKFQFAVISESTY